MAPEKNTAIIRKTLVQIDLSAFRANLRTIRERIPRESGLVAVIKADGYGHGATRLARVCETEDVVMLAVALLEEALALRADGIQIPILVLGAVPREGIELAAENAIAISTPSPETVRTIAAWCRETKREARVHLQLDSGMNRMGLIEPDLPAAMEILQESPGIRIEGVFSHYANASDPDDSFNEVQRKRFARMVQILREGSVEAPVHHFANSAAVMTGKVEPGDLVRTGISLYGGEALDYEESRLEPVMRWTTRVVRLKEIEPGEIVGYGKTWTANRKSRIATLPVGYADGYDRLLSNNGDVLIRGRRVPIVGRVSMDLTTVDVTDVPEVSVDDEVILLGSQGNESIRAEELADRTGTIPYEIFTNVSRRVPRVYLGED